MPRKKAVREEYYIGLEGESIPVSEEVYYAFYGGQRQEEYQEEKMKKYQVENFSSYQNGDKNPLEVLPSSTNVEEEVLSKITNEQLYDAIKQLSEDEQDLISKIYFDLIPMKELAKFLGISYREIRYRKEKILDKLRKNF